MDLDAADTATPNHGNVYICNPTAATEQQHFMGAATTTAAKAPTAGPDAAWQEVAAAREKGRILEAQRLLTALGKQNTLSPAEMAAKCSAHGLDMQKIDEQAERVKQMLAEMKEDDGWLVTAKKPDLRVLYRHQRGSAVHSIRIEAVLAAPFEHVLALAAEYDLTTLWNPVMRETAVLHADLPFLTHFYGALWTPVVVIDVAVRAEGFDLGEEDRSLVVAMEDMSEAEVRLFGPLPPGQAKRHRGGVRAGSGFRLEPLAPSADGTPRTKGTILAHLEPRLAYVPGFLVTFILRVASSFAYSAVKKVLLTYFKDPKGIFPRRLAEKPEVYKYCSARRTELMERVCSVEAGC